MKVKLAQALLRRKELQEKLDRLRQIDNRDLYEVKTGRKQAHEGIDDIIAQVPKMSFTQFTHAFDWHARALREVDAVIQQTNWTAEVDIDERFMGDYEDPHEK